MHGSVQGVTPKSRRRCAPPYPVRDYIERHGTQGLGCPNAYQFELMRLDGNTLCERYHIRQLRVTAVGDWILIWLHCGGIGMLSVCCVGDRTYMPFVRSYKEVVFQERMAPCLTRTY